MQFDSRRHSVSTHASREPLPGGTQEVRTCLLFHASEYGGHVEPDWRALAIVVEAQIHVDIILGYHGCKKMGYLVDPFHDGFRTKKKDQCLRVGWVKKFEPATMVVSTVVSRASW